MGLLDLIHIGIWQLCSCLQSEPFINMMHFYSLNISVRLLYLFTLVIEMLCMPFARTMLQIDNESHKSMINTVITYEVGWNLAVVFMPSDRLCIR